MITTRFMELFDINNRSATIIGCGGIGGAAAITLAKMGIGYLDLRDGDDVDDINIATQYFRISDVGKRKVDAMADIISGISDTVVSKNQHYWNGDLVATDILIAAVDSIRVRRQLMEAIDDGAVKCRWFIDARMGAENCQIVTCHGNNIREYKTLMEGITDENVPDLPCTAKATFYCAFLAGALIGNTVRKIATNQSVPFMQSVDLPFFTMFHSRVER